MCIEVFSFLFQVCETDVFNSVRTRSNYLLFYEAKAVSCGDVTHVKHGVGGGSGLNDVC